MALDAVFMQAVAEELRPSLVGGRIEKIQQPSRDQVVLLLRGGRRLLLCAGTSAPRMQWTEIVRENPASPPMFCMLLRKHLSGGRITALDQPPLERLYRLELATSDEFGQEGRRVLILEAMGRRANLILLDGEGRIVDCLRRVDAEMSPDRQLLPGLFYVPPAPLSGQPITDETEQGVRDRLADASPETPVDRFLLNAYGGLSPTLARELAFRAAGETDGRLCGLDEAGRSRLCREILDFGETVRENRLVPLCLSRNGTPFALSCVPLLQYGPEAEAQRYDSFSRLLDGFFAERDRRERARIRGAALLRTVRTAQERIARKLAVQERDYAATQNREELRLRGDLITANLYRMERGERVLTCENFYSETGETLSIPLDPLLTPQENAARYYKRYAKAKTAERMLAEQMAIARRDAEYLESVLEELERGETEQDFLDIRRELAESGFLRENGQESGGRRDGKNGGKSGGKNGGRGDGTGRGGGKGGRGNGGNGASSRSKKERNSPSRPREYLLSTGYRILVGRNNRQNDALVKSADHRDIWLHTQKIHGAHVILRTEGTSPGDDVVAEAAAAAAYFSQARESSRVPVDYTPVRYVKKPAGARPGMVVYTTYRTTFVRPALPGKEGD